MNKTINNLDVFNRIGIKAGVMPPVDEKSFYVELVKLSQIAIQKKDVNSEFGNKIHGLLEYVLLSKNSELALLLLETLLKIQKCSIFNLTIDIRIVKILVELLYIHFEEKEQEIYYYVLSILNEYSTTLGKTNFASEVPKVKDKSDLFNCENLKLSIEFMKLYLSFDFKNFKETFIEYIQLSDFSEGGMDEGSFEKMVWYGFLAGYDNEIKYQVGNYENLIKSDKWGIKFYCFIKNQLLKDVKLEQEKIDRLIVKFNKLKTYTEREKQVIIDRIKFKVSQKLFYQKNNSKVEMKPLEKVIKNQIVVSQIRRLSPSTLPTGMRLEEVNQTKRINLVVYEDKSKKTILKNLDVEVNTDVKETAYFVTKKTLKKIRQQAPTGFIDLIEKKKEKVKVISPLNTTTKTKKEKDLFKWPTTEISGTGVDLETGFREESDLKKLGYQITGSTREGRWKILQQAVPKIGLRNVAYTIAQHVKLRKGQKNGKKKFQHAIGEWEHDLNRLKQKYYKKNFIWPST